MDRNEWSRRQLGSDCVGRPVADPLEYFRLGASGPRNTVAPSISGTNETGETLTAVAGTWTEGTATGQWYANGSPISGATSLTYVVAEAYDGASFFYRETNGSKTKDSNIIGATSLLYTADSTLWTADSTSITADWMTA